MKATVPAAVAAASSFVEAIVRHADDARGARALPPTDAARIARTPHASLYGELVRATLREAIASQMSRACELLGPERIDADVARFVASDAFPSTRYLRDLPPAFLAFAAPGWADAGAAPWVVELARHELLSYEVAAAPDAPPTHVAELLLDRPLVFAPWSALARYAFPVHEIEAGGVPTPRPTVLVVYRDGEHDIRHLELTPLAAAVLERLLARSPLPEAIRDACHAESSSMPPDALARFLADLSTRGILLGSEPR